MNFYDFETFDLVSFSDKTNQPISSIQFDVEGSSLFCLSGENVRQITWEPSSLLNTWVLLHIDYPRTIVVYLLFSKPRSVKMEK